VHGAAELAADHRPGQDDIPAPTALEWSTLEQVTHFLTAFKIATKMFEGEKMVTLGIVSRVITVLIRSLAAAVPPAHWQLGNQPWATLPGTLCTLLWWTYVMTAF
jgi:hypothetical protein